MIEKISNEVAARSSDVNPSDFDERIDTNKIEDIEKNDVYNPDQRVDASDVVEYFSTYAERVEQAKNSDGVWEGEVGESKLIPNDPEIRESLKEFGIDGIEYKNGIPDFSPISKEIVQIGDMSENRKYNFRQADRELAKKWNEEEKDGRTDWTRNDVENWRQESWKQGNGYSWHEDNDMKTMYLVKGDIHLACKHLGGVSECKKYNGTIGGGFDE